MKKIIASALALAVAGSASAIQQYSDFRQNYDPINDAIAAAPDSDLHGTFNRLSALFHRSPVRDAAADAGYEGSLPANFERNLEVTLIDLQDDLANGQLDGLTPEQQLDILYAVRNFAFRRTIELWQSEEFTTCGTIVVNPCPIGQECPPPPPCVDDDPAVLNELQDVVSSARRLYATVRADLVAEGADVSELPTSNGLNADNFVGSVGTMLTIKGVESIDD
jgi:hypothetical protein